VLRAEALADGALLELFNRAYSDYYLPLRLDPDAFGAMVEVSDLDLRASPVAEVDGAPAGFALLGVCGTEGGSAAWASSLRRAGAASAGCCWRRR
jgi:hypothetical protein